MRRPDSIMKIVKRVRGKKKQRNSRNKIRTRRKTIKEGDQKRTIKRSEG